MAERLSTEKHVLPFLEGKVLATSLLPLGKGLSGQKEGVSAASLRCVQLLNSLVFCRVTMSLVSWDLPAQRPSVSPFSRLFSGRGGDGSRGRVRGLTQESRGRYQVFNHFSNGSYPVLILGAHLPPQLSPILEKLMLPVAEHFGEPVVQLVGQWWCQSLSCVQFSATPRTVALQALLSMKFPGENTGVGCHFLLQCSQLLLGVSHCQD